MWLFYLPWLFIYCECVCLKGGGEEEKFWLYYIMFKVPGESSEFMSRFLFNSIATVYHYNCSHVSVKILKIFLYLLMIWIIKSNLTALFPAILCLASLLNCTVLNTVNFKAYFCWRLGRECCGCSMSFSSIINNVWI